MRKINKTRSIQEIIYLVLFLISVIYIMTYYSTLRSYELRNFVLTYSMLYLFLASPLFFFSAFAMLSKLIISKWVPAISQKMKLYSKVLFLVLIFVQLLIYALFFLSSLPFYFSYSLIRVPILFMMLGMVTPVFFSKQ